MTVVFLQRLFYVYFSFKCHFLQGVETLLVCQRNKKIVRVKNIFYLNGTYVFPFPVWKSSKKKKNIVNYFIFVIGKLLCCFWRKFYNYIGIYDFSNKKNCDIFSIFLFIIIFKPSQKIYAVKYFVIRTLQYWVQINCLFSTKISVHMFFMFKTINLYCLLTSYYFINIILFMLFCVQYFINCKLGRNSQC